MIHLLKVEGSAQQNGSLVRGYSRPDHSSARRRSRCVRNSSVSETKRTDPCGCQHGQRRPWKEQPFAVSARKHDFAATTNTLTSARLLEDARFALSFAAKDLLTECAGDSH